ncbi:MAG: HEAT repeat domain-containing protein [Planctomycetes bacterium]|nr:HEAT repeat domain-containing protein [Planctomycetota bacterium]
MTTTLATTFDAVFSGFSDSSADWAQLRQWAETLDHEPEKNAAARGAFWHQATKLWKQTAPRGTFSAAQAEHVAEYYRQLPADDRTRGAILQFFSAVGQPAALRAFVALVTEQPPADATDTLLAFAPLFQADKLPVDDLFPALFAGLGHPVVAGAALDLANYLTHSNRVPRHPAAELVDQLASILGALVQQLQLVEENPQQFAATPQALTTLVGDCVGLIVAICNALALIGEPVVSGKLHQALALSHRQVRCEAAAALATLGDKTGLDQLIELAAFPLVRARALVLLEHLGAIERVDERFRTPLARAEAALVAWLSQPTQFGAAPSSLELIDESRQPWPGFDEPVDCFLFDVEYRAGEKSFTAIALAGPASDIVTADLEDLPPSDIFALYAGRNAEHEEIVETNVEKLSIEALALWQAERERLIAAGYENPDLALRGEFFGTSYWIATATHDGRPGVVIGDGHQARWTATQPGSRALGPYEIYWLFKGKLLQQGFQH